MTFRWLEGDEAVDLLNPDIESQGWAPLNSQTCRARVAEEDGKIVGYIVLQMHPVLGPSRIINTSKHKGVFAHLIEDMRGFLADTEARGVLTIAENPAVARLCRLEGMTRIEHPVFIQTGLGRMQ